MAYCPFQNYVTAGDVFTTVECPESVVCKLWDSDNLRCGMLVSNTIQKPENPIKSLISYFESTNTEPPKATTLINEFVGNEDVDNNGEIYGYDFKISDSDTEKPNILKAIENNPDWSDPTNEITWSQYLEWLSTGIQPY